MKKIRTESDVASVKVGNENFTMLIPNGYGDGTTLVVVADNKEETEGFNFFTIIEGDIINIYDHDCGNDVADTISGEFYVFIGEEIDGMNDEGFYDVTPIVLFVRRKINKH